YPGNNLPTASTGQRYLLINDVTKSNELIIPQAVTSPWGHLEAKEGDIVEYNGTNWYVSFNSATEPVEQYVKNLSSGKHYKFTKSREWVYTYLGQYSLGYWNITF